MKTTNYETKDLRRNRMAVVNVARTSFSRIDTPPPNNSAR
jgi:hypothetical protein